MDPVLISAGSALAGSLIGATASLGTSWLTQFGQMRAQRAQQDLVKREALYAEFIAEVSKRLADAFSHEAESPEVLVSLYAAVGRMRLMSSREVVEAASALVRVVAETYAAPNRSFRQLHEEMLGDGADPLEAFGEACRRELRGKAD